MQHTCTTFTHNASRDSSSLFLLLDFAYTSFGDNLTPLMYVGASSKLRSESQIQRRQNCSYLCFLVHRCPTQQEISLQASLQYKIRPPGSASVLHTFARLLVSSNRRSSPEGGMKVRNRTDEPPTLLLPVQATGTASKRVRGR